MNGKARIHSEKQRLDATFGRASTIPNNPELASDFARHLCVLVSGFLEQAVIEILVEFVRTRSSIEIQNFLESRLRRFTSPSANNLIDLFGAFDIAWRKDLEVYLVDEYKDAVDGVVNLRHIIAHGKFTGVTLSSVRSYYDRVKKVVDHLANLCIP